ncbi:hypothetical protein SAMN05443572_10529 [Myxococcus fulvus]|uniref:TROVE domain-containing protein n=1 Tax=Myxococcus fulvus TaxID=33 RepID=A0A511TBP7_MYXFU|nr:hypothetical protein [Myxococcus fulvus]GEN11609.1 hypothetical protein MFU01_66460 [Myxococcus fulvus]SEU11378.1 hypothetical protein SAMN05443572_10529 [Myxococcus fulvus]
MALPAEVRIEQVAREDLVMFVNACFSCTGQREFYGDARGQSVSIEFLHQYILGNYRRLYRRTLAAGINHFNQAQIILNLLAAGSPVDPAERGEEGALIAAALRRLPSQRAFRVLESLRSRHVNNRRSRAIVREYLAGRSNLSFDAVKYRSKLRAAVVHGHVKLEGELGPFLFKGWKKRVFTQPLFESFRRAHFAQEALYELPYTVAEGLAQKHGVPRDVFLQRIEPRLTQAERLRLQESAAREGGVEPAVDLSRAPLTKLALYVLSLKAEARASRREELHAALEGSAARVLARAKPALGKVAAVLDRSYSTSGSLQKRRRPLAVALATHYLLSSAAREYRAFWTGEPVEDPLTVSARGQTDLATPLLDALEWGAELVVIVSDGYDNDPPGAVAELTRVFRERLDRSRRTALVHVNPVFDAEEYAPRSFGAAVATVGVRDAEDVPTVLGFARFAEGTASLAELERYLSGRVDSWLKPQVREGVDEVEA